jgi:pimeloyl-ACP methyl ester carboxylesterase
METEILHLSEGRRIAFRLSPGRHPGMIFFGGFRSDMTGTKAEFLEAHARERGRAFLRFDYTGHGASSGQFRDGCIGDWAQDAAEVLVALTTGPQVLIGSSMGGWITLLLAQRMPARIAALVGIAAAPDFTEDGMWAGFNERERKLLMTDGELAVHSGYDDEPYVITRRLVEDGRRQLVLRSELVLPFPVRLLHGTADAEVDLSVSLRLMAHARCNDLQLTLLKDGDHRLSSPAALTLLARTLDALPC